MYERINPTFVNTPINTNILDNAYFVNPVNQRGRTTYGSESANTYTIDRWRTAYGETPYVNLDSGITLGTLERQNTLYQLIEKERIVDGNTYTVTALLTGNALLTATGVARWHDSWTSLFQVSMTGFILRFVAGQGGRLWSVDISSSGKKILALKLEQGQNQTLAHMDSSGIWVLNEVPNFNIEFIKCQRYYRKADACQIPGRMYSGTDGVFLVPGMHMRATPTCTITGGSGVSITDAGGKDIKASTVSAIRADSSGVTLSVKNATPAAQVGPATIADFYATFSADL